MTTKSRTDVMHDALVTKYGQGDMDYLLSKYYADNPTAGKFGTSKWLDWVVSKGAVGPSHADKDLDFWTRGLGMGVPFSITAGPHSEAHGNPAAASFNLVAPAILSGEQYIVFAVCQGDSTAEAPTVSGLGLVWTMDTNWASNWAARPWKLRMWTAQGPSAGGNITITKAGAPTLYAATLDVLSGCLAPRRQMGNGTAYAAQGTYQGVLTGAALPKHTGVVLVSCFQASVPTDTDYLGPDVTQLHRVIVDGVDASQDGVLAVGWRYSNGDDTDSKIAAITDSQGKLMAEFQIQSATLPTYILDSFVGANGAAINGRACDTGQLWTLHSGAAQVTGNRLEPTAVGTIGTIDTGSVKGRAEIMLGAVPADSNAGLVFRYVDANNFWRFFYQGNTQKAFLQRVLAGANTNVINDALPAGLLGIAVDDFLYVDLTDPNGFTVGIRRGNTDYPFAPTVDSLGAASTRHGFWGQVGTGSYKLDNFWYFPG